MLVGLSNRAREDLLGAIDGVCRYLIILRAIAGSAVVVDHLSVVANASRVRRSCETHKLGRPECTLEAESLENFANMGVTDVDGPPELLDTHARWLGLQVAYPTAVGDIVDLASARAPPTQSSSSFASPPPPENPWRLMLVIESVVNGYELGLRNLRLPYIDMIKTALQDLREHADPSLCQGSGLRTNAL